MTNCLIVGSGAIGCLLYQGLQSQIDCSLASRRPTNQTELHFTSALGQQSIIPIAWDQGQSQLDLVLICVKAYDVEEVLRRLQPRLSQHSIVILSHNGLGTAEMAATYLPADANLLALSTTHGALCHSALHCKHTGIGESKLGMIMGNLPKESKQFVLSMLNSALPPVTWVDDMPAALWQKLTINAVINPLTALHAIPNGELTQAHWHSRIMALCREISQIGESAGISCSAQVLFDQIQQVAHNTATNLSSMNRDIAAGRKTEIDFINGYLSALGKRHHCPTPLCDELVSRIHAITYSR